ncbi:MAG: hypothetical protein PWR01_3582 [Clostridiales bacterium]|jgi:PAS domain S-box-containing protein|nr:hypothetical protein [Clostridiales bacterium]MDN5282509.1 hypothetical protein [Candidatus Ozemobacter sp.]
MPQNSQFLPGTLEVIPCGSACEALDFLQQIYNTAPIMMLAISRELKIVRLNERFAEFLGRPWDECPGEPLSEMLPAAAESLGGLVNRVIVSENPVMESEIEFYFSDQPCFWNVSAYPLRNENSRIESVNLIAHDLTELRIAQKKLERAYEDILELQEKLKQENQLLRREIIKSNENLEIVGSSHETRKVLEQIRQVAATDAIVLVTGETGTGKELVARALHRLSNRNSQPLVTVNCAALPANLIESELFGHEKGSFTGAINRKIGRFELADGGTIFLDEIGELPLELQSKLLRVLQENQIERVGGTKLIEVNVRVIAATNRDLAHEVAAGRFREDLFYRLDVFPIHLPPLRQRGSDVIEIANAYIEIFSEKMGKNKPGLAKSSIQKLMTHSWPGNIRELRNLIERAMILCKTDTLEIEIPRHAFSKESGTIPKTFSKHLSLADVEKLHITNVLENCRWKVRGPDGAAIQLDLKPTTLESKMAKLGIKRPK